MDKIKIQQNPVSHKWCGSADVCGTTIYSTMKDTREDALSQLAESLINIAEHYKEILQAL